MGSRQRFRHIPTDSSNVQQFPALCPWGCRPLDPRCPLRGPSLRPGHSPFEPPGQPEGASLGGAVLGA
eukprot:1279128-Alexandrium_andersonii.AAC.1